MPCQKNGGSGAPRLGHQAVAAVAHVLAHGLFGAVRVAGVDAVDDDVMFAGGDVRGVVGLAHAVQAVEAEQRIKVFAEQSANPEVAAAERDLAMEFGIESIPTLLCIKGGKVVKRLVGYREKDALKKELEAL